LLVFKYFLTPCVFNFHYDEMISQPVTYLLVTHYSFAGKHSFDKIAASISQTHVNFHIETKAVMTCTDNGSNMVKAFTVFSENRNESLTDDDDSAAEEDEEFDEEDQDEAVVFDGGIFYYKI